MNEPTSKLLPVSLVSTVLNDREGMESFFEQMAAQTRLPAEIVIVDAGSHDGTWELLQAEVSREHPWQLVALQELKCNCARGRNLAIERAAQNIIVSTDIGCDWEPGWLEELADPLMNDPSIEIVVGSWEVKREKLRGVWAQVEWAWKGDQRMVASAESYSSSRSIAYRKVAWEALGRYPEDLTFSGDDAVFHYLIEKADARRAGASKVRCYWHRHETLRSFFREAYRYGVGSGEAGIEGKGIILIGGRMALEAICLVLGFLGFFPWAPFAPWSGIVLLTVAAISVLVKVYRMRDAIRWLRAERVSSPLMRLLLFNYGTKWHWLRGYAVGWWSGYIHCRDCHRRLQEMTSATYQERRQKSGIQILQVG